MLSQDDFRLKLKCSVNEIHYGVSVEFKQLLGMHLGLYYGEYGVEFRTRPINTERVTDISLNLLVSNALPILAVILDKFNRRVIL